MYSFLIKITILVNKAVLVEIITPALGLINPNVDVLIADPHPIKISVIINNILFYLRIYIFHFIIFIITFRRFQYIFMIVFF